MNRLLVTGATGFIGQQTLPLLLQEGYEVHAVTRSGPPLHALDDVRWHQIDLLDQGQAAALVGNIRPSQLLHLAWYAVPGKWWKSIENLRWLESSLFLIREFAAAGGERAVVAGSCAEYDLAYGFCSEQVTPLAPSTIYGACKHALQDVLDRAGTELGLDLAWARIFYVYGPGENPARLVPSVISSLLRGECTAPRHGAQIRDYLHSQDVASALVHLLKSEIRGPVNVGSGIPLTIHSLVSTIAEIMGKPGLVNFDEVETSSQEPTMILADVRRLNEQVGWCPRLSLEAGLEQTIDWWRRYG